MDGKAQDESEDDLSDDYSDSSDNKDDEDDEDDGPQHDYKAGNQETDSWSLYGCDQADNSDSISHPVNPLTEPDEQTSIHIQTPSYDAENSLVLKIEPENITCNTLQELQDVVKAQVFQTRKHRASKGRLRKAQSMQNRLMHRKLTRAKAFYVMSKSEYAEYQTLKHENVTLKSEKQKLESEKGEMVAKAQRFTGVELEAQSLKQQSDERAVRVAQLQVQVQNLQTSEATAVSNYKASTTTITQLQAQIQNLQTSEANAVSKYGASAAKAMKLEHDLKIANDSFESSKTQALEDANRQLKDAHETIKKLQEHIKKRESRIEAALEAQKHVPCLGEESDITKIRNENDNALSAVYTQKKKLEQDLSELQIKYAEATSINEMKAKELRLIQEERNRFSKSLTASRRELVAKAKRIDELVTAKDLLQTSLLQDPINIPSSAHISESPEVKALKAAVEASREETMRMELKIRTLEGAYRKATKNANCLHQLRLEVELANSSDNLKRLIHNDSIAPAQALSTVEYCSKATQISDPVKKLLSEPSLQLPILSRSPTHVENINPAINVIYEGDGLAAAIPGDQNQVVEAPVELHALENQALQQAVQQSLVHDAAGALNPTIQEMMLGHKKFTRQLKVLPQDQVQDNAPVPASPVAIRYFSFSNLVMVGYAVYLYLLFFNYERSHIGFSLRSAFIEQIEAPVVDALPTPSRCITFDDPFIAPVVSFGPIYQTPAPIFKSTSFDTESPSGTFLDIENERPQSTIITADPFDIESEPTDGMIQRFVYSVYGENPLGDLWWFISTATSRSLYAALHEGRCYPVDHYYYDVWYEDFVSSCMNYGVMRWIADIMQG
ncbi:hypothetical protein BGZ60DRAFT_570567 [Tricladium varicosporioides]|nr:hypothetical protein BGZ60DRAFT_570567 [Hymenoscyphus varicosporioides]